MNDKTELFETTPIPKAVMSFSLPMVMGMLVTVIYILVDTFFVAQIGDPNQVAGLTISNPVYMLLMALASIFGVGGASYISRLLGMQDQERAKRTSAFVFYMSVALGCVSSIIMLIAMDTMLPFLGATDQTYEFARGYLIWIAGGAATIVLRYGMGEIVRSVGAPKEAMIGSILGAGLNIALDPIMIFALNMGVAGAAAATIISNAVSVVYFILLIVFKNYPLSLNLKYFKPDKQIVISVFSVGLPSTLREVLMSVSMIVYNYFGSRYGEVFLAAYGIANAILMLPIMAVMGLSGGIQPLLGYTYTAGLHKRLRGVLKFTLIVATASATVLTAIVCLLGGFSMALFMDNPDVIAQGRYIIYRFALSLPILGVLFVLSTVFQALGKAKQALILSIARQGVVSLPIIIFFNYAFGLDGLIFAMPTADVISVLICIGLFLPVLRELGREDKLLRHLKVARAS